VRFSDKISNLKFHRNFTILGSKLIVLSAGTLRPSPSTVSGPIATLTGPRRPRAAGGEPDLREWGTLRKISSLLLITRHAYRTAFPNGLFGG